MSNKNKSSKIVLNFGGIEQVAKRFLCRKSTFLLKKVRGSIEWFIKQQRAKCEVECKVSIEQKVCC